MSSIDTSSIDQSIANMNAMTAANSRMQEARAQNELDQAADTAVGDMAAGLASKSEKASGQLAQG